MHIQSLFYLLPNLKISVSSLNIIQIVLFLPMINWKQKYSGNNDVEIFFWNEYFFFIEIQK